MFTTQANLEIWDDFLEKCSEQKNWQIELETSDEDDMIGYNIAL